MSWRKEILIQEEIFTMELSQGPDWGRDCHPGDPPELLNLVLSWDAPGSYRCPDRKNPLRTWKVPVTEQRWVGHQGKGKNCPESPGF